VDFDLLDLSGKLFDDHSKDHIARRNDRKITDNRNFVYLWVLGGCEARQAICDDDSQVVDEMHGHHNLVHHFFVL